MNHKILEAWEYVKLVNLTEENIKHDLPLSTTFGDTGMGDFGFIYETDEAIVIAFRGSDDQDDWISNLRVKPNEVEWHSGFYRSAKHHFKTIENFLLSSKGLQSKQIRLQGHSRGGALALTVAKFISDNYINLRGKIDVITFGCPKVATERASLKEDIEKGFIKHITVVNGLDIVPRVPPEFPWRKGDYKRYCNKLIHIGYKPTWWEKIKLLYYYFKQKENVKLKWITDHNTENYERSILQQNWKEV